MEHMHDPLWLAGLAAAMAVTGLVSGTLAGLLGVGGGIVKVPVIHMIMGAPLPVAIATSNFIIGVTAAAGASPYLVRGEIDPTVAGPMVLGVFAGAAAASRVAGRVRTDWLRVVFVVVVLYVAVQMTLRAVAPLVSGGAS